MEEIRYEEYERGENDVEHMIEGCDGEESVRGRETCCWTSPKMVQGKWKRLEKGLDEELSI